MRAFTPAQLDSTHVLSLDPASSWKEVAIRLIDDDDVRDLYNPPFDALERKTIVGGVRFASGCACTGEFHCAEKVSEVYVLLVPCIDVPLYGKTKAYTSKNRNENFMTAHALCRCVPM